MHPATGLRGATMCGVEATTVRGSWSADTPLGEVCTVPERYRPGRHRLADGARPRARRLITGHRGFGLGEVLRRARAGADAPSHSTGLQFSAVACPRCGGNISGASGSRLLAVRERGGRRRPGPENAQAGAYAAFDARADCGCTYQDRAEPQSAPSCYCGTFAVGTCTDCGMLVCGDHSALLGDRRLCTEHWRAHTHRIATERLANERLGRDDGPGAWQQRVQAQLRGATVEERLVRAVAAYTPDLHRLSTHRSEDETSWAAVCLALDTGSIPIWESNTCTTGSEAGQRRRLPLASGPSARRIIGPRCVNRDVWVFASSTVRRLQESGWAHDSIGLLIDGTLLLLRGDSAGPWIDMPQLASPLGPHGLKQMAALLDLPVLEFVPRCSSPAPRPATPSAVMQDVDAVAPTSGQRQSDSSGASRNHSCSSNGLALGWVPSASA